MLALLGLWGCSRQVLDDLGIPDLPPLVAIRSPEAGEVDADVALEGEVQDEQGRDEIVSLVWSSDLDGELATMAEAPLDRDGFTRFAATLSPGEHIVTLEVTDSTDLSEQASIILLVR